MEVFRFFQAFKILNAVIMFDDAGSRTVVYDMFIKAMSIYTKAPDVDILFPDRLRNMKGFNYKILAAGQIPRLLFDGNQWKGPDKQFIEVVTKLQNASYSIQTLNAVAKGSVDQFHQLMNLNLVDIYLGTQHVSGSEELGQIYKWINTFDSVGYCALIPAPSRLSYLKYLLTPFDAYIWISILTSVAIFAAVWRIFKRRSTSRDFDSAGHLVFGMIALFFLQAIPFRRNRPILKLVTQLFAFAMMILGTAYQSLLISLISGSHFGSKISTIDEMIARHKNYMVDTVFEGLIKDSKSFPTMNMKNFYYDELRNNSGIEASAMDGTVFVLKCDAAGYFMSLSTSVNLRTFYYILPEKFYSTYENFLTSRFSPFNERLNEISLEIFETGIRQHWVTMSSNRLQDIAYQELDNMLKLSDLLGVFYIYGFCLMIATLVFFIELLMFRWSERGAPLMLVRIGRMFGIPRKRKPLPKIGRVILEPIDLNDL